VSIVRNKAKAVTAISLIGSGAIALLFALYFISGFTALLYQVSWQRMLGLFSGSDVRSVTIVIASYLLGLGLGNLISSAYSDRLNSRQCVRVYGCCNLGIAVFAVLSRWLFYDLLFLRLHYLAESYLLTLGIVFVSLLIPTTLMGLSLPLLSKAINRNVERAASRIGWLYGVNTLGSGLGTLVSGWYLVGTLGYEGTIYLGASFSTFVGSSALILAQQFGNNHSSLSETRVNSRRTNGSLKEWYLLVFLAGFAAISWEIIWFRVLDIALQSNAYTYAHLLAFVLISNGLGSMLGARTIQYITQPKKVFLLIQGIIPLYCAIAIWLIALYWQVNPNLRSDLGYIDLNNLNFTVIFKYLIVPSVMMILPNLLMGFYFALVQKAIQSDLQVVGRRVGSILAVNILGNTLGSLVTGLILLEKLGTSGSIKLLLGLGLGLVVAIWQSQPVKLGAFWQKVKFLTLLTIAALTISLVLFPNNERLWAALQAVDADAYFIVAEDSTSVAAIAETDGRGVLLASGQIQANFPYMHIHGLLGSVPALLHPNPTDIMIIGLGSGGTPHTLGVNPLTKQVKVVELLGGELTVLKEYAKTPLGKPLKYLFQDPRYQIVVGDGRRELVLSEQKFDIIEADAIQPWRSRAGMLYSKEFFQEVRGKLKPGGFFVEWNVGAGTQATMLSVFPHVANIGIGENLWILIGSENPLKFDRQQLLTKLAQPQVIDYLNKAGIDVATFRQDVREARVKMYSQAEATSQNINTDLFPRGEYYLNRK
jgi:spermidine synthase